MLMKMLGLQIAVLEDAGVSPILVCVQTLREGVTFLGFQ